ncbi:hypothetical protein IHMA87_06199 (plasmid) [Pseudomonas paraeruginosa]|nr:hypothetical protein IHMA87_06199 [Pseudomonas aeruginosa]
MFEQPCWKDGIIVHSLVEFLVLLRKIHPCTHDSIGKMNFRPLIDHLAQQGIYQLILVISHVRDRPFNQGGIISRSHSRQLSGNHTLQGRGWRGIACLPSHQIAQGSTEFEPGLIRNSSHSSQAGAKQFRFDLIQVFKFI